MSCGYSAIVYHDQRWRDDCRRSVGPSGARFESILGLSVFRAGLSHISPVLVLMRNQDATYPLQSEEVKATSASDTDLANTLVRARLWPYHHAARHPPVRCSLLVGCILFQRKAGVASWYR
eukprot:scaffold182797_cov40-Prasinocladus_malaysianus.AAC.1